MASFNVPIVNDNILEDDETFTLAIVTGSLPSRVSQGKPRQARVTIANIISKCLCVIKLFYLLALSYSLYDNIQPVIIQCY